MPTRYRGTRGRRRKTRRGGQQRRKTIRPIVDVSTAEPTGCSTASALSTAITIAILIPSDKVTQDGSGASQEEEKLSTTPSSVSEHRLDHKVVLRHDSYFKWYFAGWSLRVEERLTKLGQDPRDYCLNASDPTHRLLGLGNPLPNDVTVLQQPLIRFVYGNGPIEVIKADNEHKGFNESELRAKVYKYYDARLADERTAIANGTVEWRHGNFDDMREPAGIVYDSSNDLWRAEQSNYC